MKKWALRTVLVAVLTFVSLGIIPAASAADGEPSVEITGAEWGEECDPDLGGLVEFEIEASVPEGFLLKETWVGKSVLWGDFTYSSESVSPGIFGEFFAVQVVAPDGVLTYTVEVFAPNGLLLSSSTAIADCNTGVLSNIYGDVFGINEPPASARVLGTVLADTPLFSEANPDTARTESLKAGQTWFVIGQTTGTDGALWYRVFVGGTRSAWVPAAVMSVSGPVPGSDGTAVVEEEEEDGGGEDEGEEE